MVVGNKQYFISKSTVFLGFLWQFIKLLGISSAYKQGSAYHVLHQKYALGQHRLTAGKRALRKRASKLIILSLNFAIILTPALFDTDRSLLATEFWTSGSSGKCSASFAWCAHDERVDFNYLKASPPQTPKIGDCLLMTAEESGLAKNATSLTFKGADCNQKRRPICQVII
jgi:hypothetical protein